jgi:hypothetical protein
MPEPVTGTAPAQVGLPLQKHWSLLLKPGWQPSGMACRDVAHPASTHGSDSVLHCTGLSPAQHLGWVTQGLGWLAGWLAGWLGCLSALMWHEPHVVPSGQSLCKSDISRGHCMGCCAPAEWRRHNCPTWYLAAQAAGVGWGGVWHCWQAKHPRGCCCSSRGKSGCIAHDSCEVAACGRLELTKNWSPVCGICIYPGSPWLL